MAFAEIMFVGWKQNVVCGVEATMQCICAGAGIYLFAKDHRLRGTERDRESEQASEKARMCVIVFGISGLAIRAPAKHFKNGVQFADIHYIIQDMPISVCTTFNGPILLCTYSWSFVNRDSSRISANIFQMKSHCFRERGIEKTKHSRTHT